MSNIFNFRPSKKETPSSDFLKDADDTVEFIHTGHGVRLGDAPQHFLKSDLAQMILRDWSNQELADIYRVKTLLDAAGVPNELERGISDEGDPWCIFCSTTGEVFIHLSRIDGGYVLDSPNLRAPIFGADFAELIAEFSAGALAKTPATEKGDRRVINLHRNGKVFLHPSALLAALVWSIYLNSEDLVMFAPEDEALAGSAGEDAIAQVNEMAMGPVTATEKSAAAHFMDTTVQPDQMITTRLADPSTQRDGATLKDISGKMALVATHMPIAVGLSSIAIAFGIMSEGFFDLEPQEGVVATDTPLEVSGVEIAPVEREQDSAARGPKFDLVAVLKSTFNHALTPEEEVQSALSIEIAGGVDLSTVLSSMLTLPEQTDIEIDLKGAFQQSWAEQGLQEAVLYTEDREKQQAKPTDTASNEVAAPPVEQVETASEAGDLVIASAKVDPVIDLASLTAFKAYTSSAFQTFDFGGMIVEATFDIESLSIDTSVLLATWSETSAGSTRVDRAETDTIDLNASTLIEAPGFNQINVNARAFIEYLISRSDGSDGVEMIFLPTEFVLLDSDALLSDQQTLSMEWELEDGNTIFTVGSRSDFLEYGLIA